MISSHGTTTIVDIDIIVIIITEVDASFLCTLSLLPQDSLSHVYQLLVIIVVIPGFTHPEHGWWQTLTLQQPVQGPFGLRHCGSESPLHYLARLEGCRGGLLPHRAVVDPQLGLDLIQTVGCEHGLHLLCHP